MSEARRPEVSLSPRPSTPDTALTDRQRLMLEAQPAALFLMDAGGTLVEAAGAWPSLLGYAPGEVVGRRTDQLFQVQGGTLRADSGRVLVEALHAHAGTVRAWLTWRRVGGQLAGQLLPAPDDARTLFILEQRAEAAEEALDEALHCLGLTLDVWKGEHVNRLVGYASRLGQVIGLGAAELRALRWGAALHDVGKARVPSGILFKPGPLTPEERVVVQQHPRWGLEVLDQLPFLPDGVRDVVLHHHERWDGLGYPVGLSGEGIPLLARITAITDVFDALTSERSYKRAWTYQDAVAHLEDERWKQFDGRLVDVFVAEVLRL